MRVNLRPYLDRIENVLCMRPYDSSYIFVLRSAWVLLPLRSSSAAIAVAAMAAAAWRVAPIQSNRALACRWRAAERPHRGSGRGTQVDDKGVQLWAIGSTPAAAASRHSTTLSTEACAMLLLLGEPVAGRRGSLLLLLLPGIGRVEGYKTGRSLQLWWQCLQSSTTELREEQLL